VTPGIVIILPAWKLDAVYCAGLKVGAPHTPGIGKAPRTTMRTRQRLARALIAEILSDFDEAAGEIVLVIHWKGGQHSELRVRKPKAGEHGCRTVDEALAVIRTMAGRWSDQDIAASRPGRPTASARCVGCVVSTATVPPRRAVNG
jgi:hypothetical protein